MTVTKIYQNESGEPISLQQKQGLDSFEEITLIDGEPKRIDTYSSNRLLDIRYYKDIDETDEQILAELTPLNPKEIAIITVQIQGKYAIHTALSYFNGIYDGEPRVTIFDEANNEITNYWLNPDTNQPEYVTKYHYDKDGEWIFEFNYDAQGNLIHMLDFTPGSGLEEHVITPDKITSFYYFRWADMAYYHHALPLTPDGITV